MRGLFRTSAILLIAAIGIGFSHEMLVKRNTPEIVEDDYDDVPVRKKRRIKRKPASVSTPPSKYVPRNSPVTTSRRNENPFKDMYDNPPPVQEDAAVSGSNPPPDEGGSGGYYAPSRGERSYRRTASNTSSDTKKSPTSSSGSSLTTLGAGGGTMYGSGGSGGGGGAWGGDGDDSDSTTDTTSSPDNLTCSADIGGGTYGNPLQVTLTCTASAAIKYCIQSGSCCDPATSGTSYSSPIVIGAEDGSYCLSFYGESASVASIISQNNYTINNTYPDIQINYPKTYYQTTQLEGLHYLTSNDFGQAGFSIGEINLKTNDPGPAALNLDCQDIVTNYVSLPDPNSELVFNPMDMAAIAFGSQLNVPLVLDKLAYGPNFITSYVLNNNYAAPLYSCSTNRVTLFDFDFFVPEASHGDAGTNQVREFSGSFVSYSFFEADADVNRTPAGSAKQDDTGQELQAGSFGVFY